MQEFTISDIEMLSGIKAQTLRVWEQRYGILIPERKQSKHRVYSNEDLKQILCIAHLNRSGLKISKIAGLSKADFARLITTENNYKPDYEYLIRQLLTAAMDFNDVQFNKVYDAAYAQIDFEKIVLNIFYPMLMQTGKCWMTDQMMPSQEHFLSEMILSKIELEIQQLKTVSSGPSTLLFLPKGEYHRIPLLFITYLLKKNNKRAVNLGGDVSLDVIQKYINKRTVSRIHLHLITELFEFNPDNFFKKLLHICKDQQIILSGPASANIRLTHKRLLYLSSMQDIMRYAALPA
jgi:DNA-binding transcriptional MerR regulator